MTNTVTADSATQVMSETVSALASTDVPADVRRASSVAITVVIADAVGGSHDLVVDRSSNALLACGLDGDVAVLGRRELYSPYASALLTGVAATAGGRNAALPAVAVVAAGFAFGQVQSVSTADIVTAVAVGSEVAFRIGDALGAVHAGRGWDIAGTLGVVGAAVAAGRLARLSPEQMQHAVALAATQAAGHRAQAGTMAAALHAGKAAADGIEAVQLAAQGVHGPGAALEGRRGMGVLMADGIDVGRLLDGLGVTWSDAFLGSSGPVPAGDDVRGRFFTRVEPILEGGATALWARLRTLDGPDSVATVVSLSHPHRDHFSDKRLVD